MSVDYGFPQPTEEELDAPVFRYIGCNPFWWKIVQGKISEIAVPALWDNYTEELDQAIEALMRNYEPEVVPVPFSGLKLYTNANQSIPNNIVTTVTWQNEITDTEGAFTPTGTIIEVPFDTYCRITVSAAWASNATDYRQIALTVNGVTIAITRLAAVNGNTTIINCVYEGHLLAGDEITVTVRQTSGGALDLIASEAQTWVAVQWLGE